MMSYSQMNIIFLFLSQICSRIISIEKSFAVIFPLDIR